MRRESPDPHGVVHIRALRPDDRAAWQVLWDGYNAFYGRQGRTALAESVTATTWSRFFDPAEPVRALVAERDGRVLGLAHYLFHRSTIQRGPSCYLQDLFTAEPARGTSVGQRLIEAVAAEARRAGAERLYWQTHETNAAARRLYDRLAHRTGFIVYRHPL